MEDLFKQLEEGLTLEQIGSLFQQQTNDILYICHGKLHNVGIFDDMFDHFRDEGQEYEIVSSDEAIPSWTLRLKNTTANASYDQGLTTKPRYGRTSVRKSYTFFDKRTVDNLLGKDDGDGDDNDE